MFEPIECDASYTVAISSFPMWSLGLTLCTHCDFLISLLFISLSRPIIDLISRCSALRSEAISAGTGGMFVPCVQMYLTRFNKIAIKGTPQMAVD